MSKSMFSESQIVKTLAEGDAGMAVAEICWKQGISNATLCKYKAKYGRMDVSDARKLKRACIWLRMRHYVSVA